MDSIDRNAIRTAGKLNECKKGGAQPVVAGGNAAKLLELVEEALDVVALAIDRLLPVEALLTIGLVGDIGDRTLAADQCPDVVSIVGLVGNDDCALLEAVEPDLCTSGVVVLTGRDQQADRAALRVDPRVGFRGEASSTSPNTTNSTLFLTPEGC